MKRKVLFCLSFCFVVVAIAIGVDKSQSKEQLGLSDWALANVEALASGENTKECPGGYCSYKDSMGNECNACCPDGKDPKCDSFGCTCE